MSSPWRPTARAAGRQGLKPFIPHVLTVAAGSGTLQYWDVVVRHLTAGSARCVADTSGAATLSLQKAMRIARGVVVDDKVPGAYGSFTERGFGCYGWRLRAVEVIVATDDEGGGCRRQLEFIGDEALEGRCQVMRWVQDPGTVRGVAIGPILVQLCLMGVRTCLRSP